MNMADLIAKVVKATNPNEKSSTGGGTELRSSQRTKKQKEQSTTQRYSAHISATISDSYGGHEEVIDDLNQNQFGGIKKTIVTTVIPKSWDEDEIGSESSSTRHLKK
jgi:hypothetical protein